MSRKRKQGDPSPRGAAKAKRSNRPAEKGSRSRRTADPEGTSARHFHVPEQAQGQTLAAFLRSRLGSPSWKQVRKLVLTRHVTLNGNLCLDSARRLRPGEVVKLLPAPAALPPRVEDVRIHFIDPHIIVVEKPAGMTTLRHPEERFWPARRKQLQPTLDEILPKLIARMQNRRRTPRGLPRIRMVHRLDRETSGLLVVARTFEAQQSLVQQFRTHAIHRRYLAIAAGRVPAQTIRTRLVRDRGDGRRGSSPDPNVGQEAVTHVRPLETGPDYTLVECQLETGRTHQIRIHLSEIGHPLIGEKVYLAAKGGPSPATLVGAPRHALHAAELGFAHPITGRRLVFKSPLPPDLAEVLARLRKRRRQS
jgi:23S rRNA pseudouridine1911/1915/1917 synthase